MPDTSVHSTLIAADGTPIALRRWPPVPRARGTVLLVHGLGEHAGRYTHVADALRAWGWDAAAYDHRGHGASGGKRGVLRTSDDLLADLAMVVDAVRTAGAPLILLGHLMGGPVAARFALEGRRPVDGLVMSSPAIDPGLSVFQRAQLVMAHALAPGLAVGNGLNPDDIAHDPAVVRAYREDPLVHDRVSARLARCLVENGDAVLRGAPAWRVPTLLLYAGADRLVAPRGSDAFAAAAPPDIVATQRFDALYHEILNEGEAAAPVFAALGAWLDRRFPRATTA